MKRKKTKPGVSGMVFQLVFCMIFGVLAMTLFFNLDSTQMETTPMDYVYLSKYTHVEMNPSEIVTVSAFSCNPFELAVGENKVEARAPQQRPLGSNCEDFYEATFEVGVQKTIKVVTGEQELNPVVRLAVNKTVLIRGYTKVIERVTFTATGVAFLVVAGIFGAVFINGVRKRLISTN